MLLSWSASILLNRRVRGRGIPAAGSDLRSHHRKGRTGKRPLTRGATYVIRPDGSVPFAWMNADFADSAPIEVLAAVSGRSTPSGCARRRSHVISVECVELGEEGRRGEAQPDHPPR